MEETNVAATNTTLNKDHHEHSDECAVDRREENTHVVPDNNQSSISNFNSDGIDEETKTKLRGDAIGDTMYSESFVLKTLLQLSDLQWSEKVEEDLCFLWDMTVEEDVCTYLNSLSFPSLACPAIVKYEEKRFVEIVIGILANMYSFQSISPTENSEVDAVLDFIGSDDHLILIQVMRFVKAVSYKTALCKSGKLEFVTLDVLGQIKFILNNSVNVELLLVTLDVVSKITVDFKVEESLLNESIIGSSLSAYQMVKKINSDAESNRRTALTHLVQIVLNFCCRVNAAKDDQLLIQLRVHSKELTREFFKVLNKTDSIPLDDDSKFHIAAFVIIFPILNVQYNSRVCFGLCRTIRLLMRNDECFDDILELAQYFISIGTMEELKRCYSGGKFSDALCAVLKHASDDFNVRDKVASLIEHQNVR